MKLIKTVDRFQIKVDNKDFDKLNQFSWYTFKPSKGKIRYVRTLEKVDNGRSGIAMHRLIMGNPKGFYVDHINGNGLDNRRKNLRLANNALNQANSRKKIIGHSKYKGVSFSKEKKKWRAYICPNKTYKHLGYFKTQKDAALAYNKAARKIWKNFAYLNKV